MTDAFFKYPDRIIYEHLISLPFQHGRADCYTMAQRVYSANTPIVLRDYARAEGWWLGDEDLYRDNFKKEGFVTIDADSQNLWPLDAFLIAIPDQRDPKKLKTNHCAIYVGNGHIVHHRYGCLSEHVPYRGAMRQLTTHVLRHKDMREFKFADTEVNIIDRILPEKRDRILKAIRAREP